MNRETEDRTGGEDRGGSEDRKFLRDHLERLPRSVEPRRDLWPDIEREIRSAEVLPGRFRRWRREILALAAVLTLFAAALAVGRFRPAPVEVAEPGRSERAPDAVAAMPADPADTATEAFHAAAAEDVMARLDGDHVDPVTAEVIRRNLAIIDGAVEEIRRALEADPANPALTHLLAAEYHRRGALLRQAARLADPI